MRAFAATIVAETTQACKRSVVCRPVADALLEKGDLDGHAVWKRILQAVEELGWAN